MAFIRHTKCEKCGSSDANALYKNEDGSVTTYCWSCDTFKGNKKNMKGLYRSMKQRKKKITREQMADVINNTSSKARGYRSVIDRAVEKYGIRNEYEDGQLKARYYPTYDWDEEPGEYNHVGYKIRVLPKDFSTPPIGRADASNSMFGQQLFKNGGRWCVIVGGEEDAPAGYQIMRKEQVKRGKKDLPPVAVISPTSGEAATATQVKNNYSFFTKFDNIVVALDNDKAGKKAAEAVCKALPPGKAYVATLPAKDPCECLDKELDREFVRSIYGAKKYNPGGIVSSADIFDRIVDRAKLEKIPLPPFANRLQKMMAGGIPLGYIITLASASGSGKSTVVNEFIYEWMFNSPYKAGIVSLESDPGEYGENLLSRHIETKLALIENPQEKLEFLQGVKDSGAYDNLVLDDEGKPRFYMLDHQGSVDDKELQEKSEYLVLGCGCKIIIYDPLTLALAGKDNNDIDEFTAWQKKFVSRHNATIINVAHVRKNQTGQKANSRGAELSEEDLKGSGSLIQVSGGIILVNRDKYAEDPIERNTTKVTMSKCRWTGNTGPAGKWFYSNSEHKMQDAEEMSDYS